MTEEKKVKDGKKSVAVLPEKKSNSNKKPAQTAKSAPDADVKQTDNTLHQHSIPLLLQNAMDDILESVKNCYKDFTDLADAILTDSQRKVGAGNKNYGFIDKALARLVFCAA